MPCPDCVTTHQDLLALKQLVAHSFGALLQRIDDLAPPVEHDPRHLFPSMAFASATPSPPAAPVNLSLVQEAPNDVNNNNNDVPVDDDETLSEKSSIVSYSNLHRSLRYTVGHVT